MIRITSCSILLLIFFVSIKVSAEDKSDTPQRIEVLGIEYPPFITEAEEHGGICYVLLRDYLSNLGLDYKVIPKFVPPARAEVLLNNGRYCLSFYPPRESREKFGFQSLGSGKVALGLIRMRQEAPFEWASLSELEGATVGVLRSSKASPLVQELQAAGAEIVYFDSMLQGIKQLKAGRTDYTFGDQASLDYHVDQAGMNGGDFQMSDTALFEAEIGFFYRKECKDLLGLGSITAEEEAIE
jgi:polar amino acid transport system substrate-binding protein